MTRIDGERSKEIISPGNSIDAVTCALSREAMIEIGETIASLGTSLSEAAWRDSAGGVRLHMVQLRETFKVAVDILKRWEASTPGEGSACE